MAEKNQPKAGTGGRDYMLEEAREAIRTRQLARARDLLTRMLKEDGKNASYWVYMSAAVESKKERQYCLETAHNLDPDNAAAKRGLQLMGLLPVDKRIQPFPDLSRRWKDALVPPKPPKEEKPLRQRIWFRILAVTVLGSVVIGLLILVTGLWQGRPTGPAPTATHRPTFTHTLTTSPTPVFRTNTPTFLGPTPLAFFLPATYTRTPLYLPTEHPILTRSSFEAGLRFLEAGDYKNARVQFEVVLDNEPGAADAWYYIGETYQLEENYSKAREAYQEAINLNAGYAPAFLGRALAMLALDPEAYVLEDLDTALRLDDGYVTAYVQRGAYQLGRGNPRAGMQDLEKALTLDPASAPAWMYLAQAQLEVGEVEKALESALTANELDMTLVPVYLTLARAYLATGQTGQVTAVLQTYILYGPEDVDAYLALATALNAAGEYASALNALNRYLDAKPVDPEAFFQRGLTHLNMGNPNLAEDDFKDAIRLNPFDFDAQLGLARAYFDQGKPGNAYVQAETYAYPLAKTDITRAQVYYWEALFLEEIDDPTSQLGARNLWQKLLALPADVMPAEWREAAFDHLGITPTFTPSPTRTPTRTRTPSPTSSPGG